MRERERDGCVRGAGRRVWWLVSVDSGGICGGLCGFMDDCSYERDLLVGEGGSGLGG